MKFTSYDPDDLKASFHQVAEQLQKGDATAERMSIEIDAFECYSDGAKITFEVYIHKF